jgi:potassium intermediate/small conductance calcium-activated channel subfamily N protein 2
MIITMATVGYGDYYARTIPGRFVTLIAAIVGVFLVSIMVVALTNTLNMNPAEQKARTNNYQYNLDNVINRLSVR